MIKLRQIKVDVLKDSSSEIKNKISKKLNINKNEIEDYKILKKSIDARDKNNIYYVYEVSLKLKDEEVVLNKNNKDVVIYVNEEYNFKCDKKKDKKIVIAGSGPAGLFCAYILLENGYKPIIIERGKKIEERVKDVEEFWNKNVLKINSNVQFGEGGAGTFSDGKLNTLVKDKNCRMKKVFETFVKYGANENILYENKPHIGTDVLRKVIVNMRNDMIKKGAIFKYDSLLTDIIIKDNKVSKIEINKNEYINCDNLVLAIGHSARDTFYMLKEKNVNMINKPFAVGIRIQHSQNMINESQYGKKYSKVLPAASYKLTYTSKNKRGVYSFCMCPGGYVVNSSSEENRIVINGMSNSKRDELNANSAIVVQIDEKDYGEKLLSGIEFQRKLEEKAFNYGKGLIPIQLYGDFKKNVISKEIENIKPIFKGDYTFSNINDILPKYICNDLIEAIEYYGTKIKGFNKDDAIIAAVETRTSSPVRILRDDNYECNIKGIFPIGEGAGYSGGITTSAMDGIRCAEKICNL